MNHIGSRTNEGYHTTSTGTLNGHRFIICASGCRVDIYTEAFQLQQTINISNFSADDSTIVTAVAISSPSGKIAASQGHLVYIFEPHADETEGFFSIGAQYTWVNTSSILHEFDVRCICWGTALNIGEFELFTGGIGINFWNHQKKDDVPTEAWVLVWSTRLANEIHFLECSPEGRFFATFGKDDNLPKIWFSTEQDLKKETLAVPERKPSRSDMIIKKRQSSLPGFSFVYIPHPWAVVCAEWKTDPDSKYEDISILTTCQDQVARIWVCSNPQSRLYPGFEMRCSLDPFQNVAVDSETKSYDAIHWLNPKEVRNLIELRAEHEERLIKSRRKSGTSVKRGKKLMDTVKEYSTMLFSVSSDRSLSIWGVQYLEKSSNRVPRLLLILKINDAVEVHETSFFRQATVFGRTSKLDKSATFFPPELFILGQNKLGLLNCFSMNLDDFFGSPWASSCLRTEHSWSYHVNSARILVTNSSDTFFASVSSTSEISIFSISNIPSPSRILTYLCDLEHDNVTNACWLPEVPYLLISDEDRNLAVYKWDGNVVLKVGETHVMDDASIDSLRAIRDPNTKNYSIVAVTKSGNICAWKFDLQGHNLSAVQMMSLGIPSPKSWILGPLARDFLRVDDGFSGALNCGDLFVILTHSSDSKLRMWGVSVSSSSLNSICIFETNFVEKPLLVKAGPFTKLAIAYRDDEGVYQVIVWSSNALGYLPLEESKLPLRSKPTCMEFSTNFDGYSMLAVATEADVIIYRQKNISGLNPTTSWDVYVTVDSYGVASSLLWILDDTLLVATPSRLVAVKYSAEPSRIHNETVSTNTTLLSENSSAFLTSSPYSHRRLPDYHPALLLNCLYYGQHETVKGILVYLLRYLDQAQECREEISEIPSLFWTLMNNTDYGSSEGQQTVNYDALFTLDDVETNGLHGFNDEKAERLSSILFQVDLPGLSKLEKQHLGAIAKTFVKVDQEKRSLDENGTRFVVSSQLFLLSSVDGVSPVTSTLSTRDIAWAYFSESEDVLLGFCSKVHDNKMLWKHARSLGIGFWLRGPEAMKRTVELIARNLYMSKEDKDPVDCSLFYILLRKKNVLFGLWKLASSHPEQNAMIKFLANDFTEDRWQKAAAKNAYALLGKQRYEYAAAFFLLADKLKDAVNVCLKQLGDVQLAIVLCRIYEGDASPILDDIIRNVLLQEAMKNNDQWMLCIARSILKDYDGALRSLVSKAEGGKTGVLDPTLYFLYNSLKKSFKVRRLKVKEIEPDVESELFFNCAVAFDLMGCPTLALKALAEVNPVDKSFRDAPKRPSSVSEPVTTKETASNEIDWSAPISKAPNEIDWGAPVSKQSEDIDWGAPVSKLSEPQDFDWGAPVSKPVTGGLDDDYEAFKKSLLGSEPTEQKTDDFDWGAPVSKSDIGGFDDDYEAFKKSLMGDSSGTDALDAEIGLDDITGSDERETESPSDTLSVLISKDNIKIYEWSLALKVAGLALSSIEDVSVQERLFKNDPMLNEFSLSVKTGLDSLEKAVAFPANAIRSILRRRCKVSSNIVSYMHLNALYSYDTYLEDFSDILLRMTNHLCLITFDPPSLPPNYRNISRLSRQLLFGVMRYHELAGNSVPAVLWPSLAQATAAAVIALSCSAVKLYDYKTLWWIAGLSDKLFTLLAGGGKKTELWPLLSDILNTKNPLAHPESGSDSSSDDDYDDDVRAKKRKLAELILDSILLQHLALDFEVFVTHTKESGAFTSQGNLAERALLGVSKLIHSLQSEMIPVAQDLHPSSSLVHRNLTTQDQKLLWSLLRRTTNLGKMIDFATGLIPKDVPIVEGPPSPVKEDLDVLEIEGSPKRKTVKKLAARAADYQIVYNADNIIAGFAINPLDPDSIAIATHDSVIEIDVASSLSFYKRRESFAERRESVDDLMVKQPSLDFHREGRSDPPKKIPRNLSYDSLERALKRSMISLRKQASEIDSGERIKRTLGGVTSIEAHPSLNYYLAGHLETSGEATVKLFQFGQQRELVSYLTGGSARITRCRFDPFGIRFGATTAKGELHIWRFDSSEQALRPAIDLTCNSTTTNDFTFLNCSTLLATAGVSASGNNIALWDTLLSPSKARIKTFSGVESGAYSTVFSPRHNILLAGTKRGDILVFDIRQQTLRKAFHAHGNTVKALAIDVRNDCLISGSAAGDVKIWDLTQFEETEAYDKMHMGPTTKGYNEIFSGMTSYGVMQINTHGGYTYTCGADGSLRKSTLSR